jgi:hypothetical protein
VGPNIDTAFFSGARIGYSVARNSTTGVVTVTDIDVTDGDEGTDTLTNVEFLNFDWNELRLHAERDPGRERQPGRERRRGE